MKKSKNIIIALIAIVLFACSSKKENDPSPNTGETPTGMLYMHLHNYLDITEVDDYNIVYTTNAGRKISLTTGQFYISDIKLVKLDGSIYAIPNKTILKIQTNQVYQLGLVPVGNYKSIQFKVGLSSTQNSHTPSNSVSDIFNQPAMWFSSSAQPDGYVFLNFEGKIDTTTAANDLEANMQFFQYHIGTNNNYKQVVMPDKNFTVVKDQSEYLHLYADYVKLFNGIQLNNHNNLIMASPSDNATVLGIQLRNNIPSMFSYE